MGKGVLNILIPVYEEEDQIYENIVHICSILDRTEYEYEILIIDDGSRDNTWEQIIRLMNDRPEVSGVRFSRNFGKEAALCAGMDRVMADAVIVMDSDLQHPPEKLPEMIALWEQGYEVVDGVKDSRGKEKAGGALSANLFYGLLNRFSGINLKNASDFKLMDRKVVEAFRKLPERDTFFRAMSFWVGFRRVEMKFTVAPRNKGKSKWSFISLMRLAVTAITSFSAIPLQIVTVLGMLFLLGSVVLGIHTLYMKFSGMAVSGFTTVILLLLIIGSGIMISLGIIGIYVSRIYDEVKRRPRYIVAEESIKKQHHNHPAGLD
ncbi:MAG TPA: glycosyltransferase family 2 protein [Clostridia bacterium]|nr:glycosyltransferase family 2 protein [Clostridia bacterium]